MYINILEIINNVKGRACSEAMHWLGRQSNRLSAEVIAGDDSFSPAWISWYCSNVLGGRRWPAGESILLAGEGEHYVQCIGHYAKYFVKGPFPAGEAAIATSPYWSLAYSRDALKGPFPAGEAAIAKNPRHSLEYARDVLKGPFPAGEAAVAISPIYSLQYATYVLKGPFPAGEAAIADDPFCAKEYDEGFTNRG